VTSSRAYALPPPPAPVRHDGAAPVAATALARDIFGREIEPQPQAPAQEPSPLDGQDQGKKREAATDALGRRAGALSDELDFPAFVASLVNGTFDAMVDSSIRQMESFAELVAAVAKPLDQFAQENVTLNQARDWLVEQYPRDVILVEAGEGLKLAPRTQAGAGDEKAEEPVWLAEFGLEGAGLTEEVLEEELLPKVRDRVAQQRMQTLATMVLLGMNRIVIKDGTIGARLRFRAAASDRAAVQYAQSDDPTVGATSWGSRGASTSQVASTKVSTVGVNVQADSELKAELFGEVKINFASETVPLDRFLDEAQRNIVERHSRNMRSRGVRSAAPVPVVATPSPAPAVSLPPPPTSVRTEPGAAT
jgi:hypothetical protein